MDPYLPDEVRTAVGDAVGALLADALGASVVPPFPSVERPDPARGDLATPVAFALAKSLRAPPPKIAERLAERLRGRTDLFAEARPEGGFVNLVVAPARLARVPRDAVRAGAAYGTRADGAGAPVLVEHTSANPTGPLHVGHGRGAAVGDAVARLLARAGHPVTREYYVNDSGRQVALLGRSVRRAAVGGAEPEAEDGYRGAYIADLGAEARRTLGADPTAEACARWASERLLGEIRTDLEAFGVSFDAWFRESALWGEGRVEAVLDELRRGGHLYRAERPEIGDVAEAAPGEAPGGEAEWFRSGRLGDRADRVVIRADGAPTYFAADVAYHAEKARRGFRTMVNVWGQDHHGYVGRVRAALSALGGDPDALRVVLVQMVRVYRGGEEVRMSKRTGTYVTLREVVEEVGRDAARFFFLLRSPDAHLDFDLDLAKRQAPENPVFYVQYVHARVASLLSEAAARGVAVPEDGDAAPENPEERALLLEVACLPDVYRDAAERLEPHRLTAAALSAAGAFHRFYTAHRILGAPPERERARLLLARAVGGAVRGLLETIGASAPERM